MKRTADDFSLEENLVEDKKSIPVESPVRVETQARMDAKIASLLQDNNILATENEATTVNLEALLSKQFSEKILNLSVAEKGGKRTAVSKKAILKFLTENQEIKFELDDLENYIENNKKEAVFAELENAGFIEKKEGLIIFNTENFKNSFGKKFVEEHKQFYSFLRNCADKKQAEVLYKLFNDYEVVSKEDYEKGDREPKNLFYFPKNSEDALDIEKIKQSEFYFLLSDVVKNVPYDKLQYGAIDDLNYREVVLAALIYHPQYGDGYRDEKTEKLMVRKDKDTYQKFSSEYIYQNYGQFRDKNGDGIDSGRRFFRKVTPHLLEKGLLKLTDSQLQKNQGEKTEANSRKIGSRGTVMFGNVRHTLGAKYKNDIAHKINSYLGAIVKEDQNRKKIIALFNIIPEEDAQKETSQDYKIANIDQAAPRSFEEERFHQKKENETIEEYRERIEAMENFEYVLQSEKYLRDELGITLEKFSPREQAMIAKMLSNVSVLQKEKIGTFITNFGDNGLKTFLSLEHGGQEMGEKILKIGEKFNQETADAIFAKYTELVDTTNNIRKYIKEQFGNSDDIDGDDVEEKILLGAKRLLDDFAQKDIKNNDTGALLQELGKINARVELTGEIIRQLPRESVAQLDLSQLSDIERHVDLKAIDLAKMPELLEKMKSIVKNKFPNGDDEVFIQDCLGENNNGLTVTMANGELLSFFMKKKLGKNLSYLDWFSANQDAPIKGLGEATVLLGFNQTMKKDENYYAVAKPYVKSFGTLIEQLGFVGFGEMTSDGEYKHHYSRTRRLPVDLNYASKKFSPEQNSGFIEEIKKTCLKDNQVQAIQFDNKAYQACRVSFPDINPQVDITKGDETGWLYQEIERQSQLGNILTRYIPTSQDKNNTIYYAVFEPDQSTPEERKDLENYLLTSKLRHSDSKNNENS